MKIFPRAHNQKNLSPMQLIAVTAPLLTHESSLDSSAVPSIGLSP
jgi:hypothetical protein